MSGKRECRNWNGKHILVSNCYGLGDLITCTPALRRLKEKYPDCYLTVVANPGHIDAIKGLPYIDCVVGLPRKKIGGRLRLLPLIRKQDAVVFTDWQPQMLLLAYVCGVSVRGGIERKGHRASAWLTDKVLDRQRTFTEYAGYRRAKEIGDALGVELDGDMTQCDVMDVDSSVYKEIDKLLLEIGIDPATEIALLAPFAGDPIRYWSTTNAKILAESIKGEFGMPVIVTGGIENQIEAKQISEYQVAGKTSLLQLIGLIKRAKILVTTDSGPMHIAGATQTKTVALFSKDLPSRWAPKKNCNVVFLGVPCSPCYGETANTCQSAKCMAGITVDMVMNEVKAVMETDKG